MKKQIMSGLAIASLAVGTTVQAEEVVKPLEPSKPTETTLADTKEVTEADVKQSEEALAKSQKQVKQQESVVAEAEKAKTEAELAVTNAELAVTEAETLVEQATPETVATVKSDIATLEENLVKAETAIVDAQNNLSQAEVAVVKQEAVIAEVSKEKVSKDQAVALAEAEVAKAQGILDGTNQASVIKEAEDAKQALTKAETDLATAEADLLKAQEADAKRAEAISALTDTVSKAESEVATKEQVLAGASKKANETGIALVNAQNILIEAENKVNAINTITISPEYIQALKDYSLHYREKGEEAKKILDRLSKTLKTNHVFKANAEDTKVVFPVNDIPEETLLELSQFAADLINQIRRQFGTHATVVTPSSIKFADLTTDGYVSHNWTWDDVSKIGHDAKAVNEAAKSLGLETTKASDELKGKQYYENMFSSYGTVQTLNLTEAKFNIYDSILEFMFNGYEYLHAESIAGLGSSANQYFGVDLSSRDKVLGTHFLLVEDGYISDASKFDKTVLANPYNSELLKQAYEKAKTNYNQAKISDDKAQESRSQAQVAYDKSLESLSRANADLTKAKEQPILTTTAQTKRDQANTILTQANQRHIKAQEAVKALSADVKEKQKALEEAKKVLVVKQVDKDKVLARLNKEQAVLSTLTQEVAAKKVSLGQAKQVKSKLDTQLGVKKDYLKQLSNAPELLKEAQSNLEKAKQTLLDKVAVLEKEVAVLKTLQEEHTSLAAQHEKVIKAYQAVLLAKKELQLEQSKKSSDLSKDKMTKASHDTSYLASTVTRTSTSPTKSRQLPKTGEATATLGLLGYILSGFGLLRLKRKK